MSLRDDISKQQVEALKSKEELRLSVLRMLWSAIRNSEIDKKSNLDDAEVQQLIARQIKQSNDALKDFVSAKRDDLISKIEAELKILNEFLPEQMSDEELEKIVKQKIEELGASSSSDIGKVMGVVMGQVKGLADGNRVREFVSKSLLND